MTTMTARQDMRTKMLRAAMTLAVMLMATVSAWAKTPTQYISEVMLIGKNKKSEAQALRDQYVAQGWTAIDQDLNAGCGSGSDYIYLLYKQRSTASSNHTFITKFYISDASGTAPDSRTVDGCTYKLVPYDGDSHFKEKKGDLNSNAGGKDIHLYYTTENSQSGTAVTQILFNATKGDAVGTFDGSVGYDLNKGAGGNDIYMHCERNQAPFWTITKSIDGSRCVLNGFEGNKEDIKAFPAIIDNAVVIAINKQLKIGTFHQLETIYFTDVIQIDTMPVTYEGGVLFTGNSSLKHVNIVDNNGIVIKEDELPACITAIKEYAFATSYLEKLKMPGVTSIGNAAFSACQYLKNITLPDGLTSIGEGAFAGCSALESITIPSSVVSIGPNAFNKSLSISSGLTLATINGNPTIGNNAFPDGTTVVLKPSTHTGGGAIWTTFYNDYANFEADASTTVYKATVSGGKVGLTEVKDKIVNAGTAVVLKKGKSNASIQLNRTTNASSDMHPNDLGSVSTRTLIADMKDGNYADYTFYVLTDKDGVGFYRYSDYWMPQNKAFLALKSSAGAREFYPVAENETSTSMEEGRWEKEDGRRKMEDVAGAWYSIDGRRLSGKPTQKGVYVHQGRKEVIR